MKRVVAIIIALVAVIGGYILLNRYADKLATDKVKESLAVMEDKGYKADFDSVHVDIAKQDIIFTNLKLSDDNQNVTIDKVVIDKIDLKNDIPQYLTLKASGLKLDSLYELENLGLENDFTFDVVVDYSIGQDGTLNINTCNVLSESVGEMNISLTLGNFDLDKEIANNFSYVVSGATINSGAITYTDLGLTNRITTLFASFYGATSEEFSQMVSDGLKYEASVYEGSKMKDYLTVIADFIVTPNKLNINITPAKPVNITSLEDLSDPLEFIEVLNLSIES